MALPKRNLTIRLNQAVSGTPDTVEVAIVPLSTPSSPNLGTFVGGVQTKTVRINTDPTDVVFELTPSDEPSLTERVIYRVGWRNVYLGREYTYDIVMPDQDIRFDQLPDLGAVLGGETYLKITDRGRAGGVAGLNDDGEVVDVNGDPVTGAAEALAVSNRLDNEIVDRQDADRNNFNELSTLIGSQITAVTNTTAANLATAVANLHTADVTEANTRSTAITQLNDSLDSLQTDLTNSINTINTELGTVSTDLLSKADLDSGGKVPVAQLPDITLGQAVSVANQAAMLALTNVQQGDFAVRPDGAWQLQATDPSQLSNWVRVVAVSSVNGKTGVVTLTASDVGARSASVPITQADVQNLNTTLAGKTDVSVTDDIDTRLTTVEDDTTVVHTSGGVIDHNLLDSNVAYLDGSNQIVTKSGTVIAVGGGGVISSVNGHTGVVVLNAADVGARAVGDPIAQADVTNLTTDLAAKVGTGDSRLSDARTPTAHATSHLSAGSDPLLPIAEGDVTNLTTDLAAKASTTTVTTQGNRISSLETRVTDLEAGGGGGGGGGGSSAKTVWYDATGPFTGETALDSFQDPDGVLLKSPWGQAALDDTYYYDPAGAADGEQRYPYITPNGHLELRKWDETAPADSPPATQDDLAIIDSDLTALTSTVATKADQSALDTTNATVATKANQTDLDTTNSNVVTKASQASLDTTNATVATKADSSTVSALTTTVSGKADSSTVTTLTGRVTTVENTLPSKADLSSGVLTSSQVPNIPESKITNLVSDLAAKAPLVGGVVPVANIPTGIPQANVQNLPTSLAGKADLDGSGKVVTSQIPAIATHDTFTAANRAAMLALSTAQVQIGDVCIITATTDRGTYTLVGSDPSIFSNWLLNQPPPDAVTSVNGQTGIVVLGPSDVGARSSVVPVPQSDVQNLTTSLAGKVDVSTYTSGLATKTSTADVQTILNASTEIKQPATLVSTVNIVSLSGQQQLDGVTAALGATVLLTAQTSSVNNGLWVVNSGAWTRPADFVSAAYFVRGSLVLVSGGNTNANTIWQETNTSGAVDTNANNWTRVGYISPPFAPVAGNGILLSGTGNSTFAVKPTTGIAVTSAGVGIDTTLVVRKFAQDVPSGSATVTITHNLGSSDVWVTVRDKASGDRVELGWTVTGVNTVSLEFASAPASSQYRVVVMG